MLKILGFILILCIATTLTFSGILTKPKEDVMLVRLNRAADSQTTYGHGHHHDSRHHDGYHHGHYHGHHHGHENGHYGAHHGSYGK